MSRRVSGLQSHLEKAVEISCAHINEVNYHFTAYLPELTVLLISFLVIRLSFSGLLR